jgi:hypothetical protein
VVVRALAAADVPVVLVDPRPFDPHWSPSEAVVPLDLPPDDQAPLQVWADELGQDAQVPRRGHPVPR